jgi:DNA-binding response OmpR family regulator
MKDLKLYNLLLVGEEEEKEYFRKYFQEIYLTKNNLQAFNFYSMYNPSIIFFNCDGKNNNSISIIKEIRKEDRDTILVIVSKGKNINTLLNALPLHLSGYIEEPFQKDKVEKVLENISHDLGVLHKDKVHLKEKYTFNRKKHLLYCSKKKEVKLTKNETKLMLLLTKSKNQYVSLNQIEYTVWEEDSAFEDCQMRLKALLYGLRKKLPKDTIVNSYSLGYKLDLV